MKAVNAERSPYHSVPFDRLGGGSRLFRDFLRDSHALTPLVGPRFDDERALLNVVEVVQAGSYDREPLYAGLSDLASEVKATDAARSALEQFREHGSVAVIAGQQTGLFTGPLYTLYKALTVEHWARDLSAQLGRPVVPLFWLSTDDHDLAEVEWMGLPHEGRFETLRYRPEARNEKEPIGRLRIDAGIQQVIAQLSSYLPDSEFKPDVLASLARTYAPNGRFATAMARMWYALFPESRLVFVAPEGKAFAQAAKPVLSKALADDSELFRAYRASTEQVEQLGYHAQVHKSADQTFLFYQEQERHSIHHAEDHLVWDGGRLLTREALQAMITAHPEHFSPNVLLRPIVQNAVFPVIGVVLGPSELAYHAQIGLLYDHFGVPRPLLLPRTSATIVEATVARRLERQGTEITALKTDLDGEVARVLRARFPRDLSARFEQAAARVEAVFDEIRPEIVSFETTLEAPAKAAGVRARREVEQLAQRAHAAHKRKEEELETQLRRAALQLFPEGELQERKFNVVYYWARYGPGWLQKLYEEWPAGMREHLLWEG